MCGVIGFVDKKGNLSESEKLRLIRRMRKAVSHRGKDSKGECLYGNMALGHARLSILDTSPRGRQPMTGADGNTTITFNGEIYNFQKIKGALEKKTRFRTNTDTEVILAAYENWGVRALEKLRGMWAFALHDRKRNELFLSVDRFGIKPLYYINTARFFAFASEIKALLLLPGVKAELNTRALSEHLLFRSIAGRETLFNGIYKLLPAEYALFDLKTHELIAKTYWRLFKKKLQLKNPKRQLEMLLEKSVAEHLIADVPVGVQLSGGVDSSLVAAIARERKETNLHSFSIGLRDKNWNEFDYSKLVAKRLRTIHHELLFSERDFVRLLPFLTYHMDEPIGHSHSVPMYLLARFARRRVKALLSGEGADEVFGGYRRYEKLLEDGHSLTNRELVSLSCFGNENLMHRAIKTDFAKAYDARLALLKNSPKHWSIFDKVSFLDIQTYLTPLLMRQDKMGMAATLENRVPFLDHELVEFGFSLPPRFKVSDTNDPYRRTKPLLKEVAEKFLPKDIVYRPKIGFGQPISEWLRHKKGLGRYLNLLISSRRALYNKPALRHAIREHQIGRADHGETLWILLAFELWARIFIDRTLHPRLR